MVEQAAGVDRRAVGEVAALVEAQAEHGVARLEQGQVDGHVGVGARVRLHVGVLGAEQRLGPLAGELLDLVDDLVAAVVALAGVALAVLVGEDRAGGPQHRRRGEVLARRSAGASCSGARPRASMRANSSASSGSALGQGIGQRFLGLECRAIWASAALRGGRPRRASPATAAGSRRPGRRRRCGRPSTARWRRCAARRHAGGVQVVAQRGADAAHLVGGDLLALAAAAEHDAAVGVARRRRPGRRRRRSAGSRRDSVGVGAEVDDLVAVGLQACRRGAAFRAKPAWSEPMAIRTLMAPPRRDVAHRRRPRSTRRRERGRRARRRCRS